MPLYTDEQKRRIIIGEGFDPSTHDFDEESSTIYPRLVPRTSPSEDQSSTYNLASKNVSQSSVPGIESFRRSATQAAGPTAAGLLTTAGALALTPEPVVSKIGALGALLGAGIVGAGASYGASKLQDVVVPEGMKRELFTRPEDIEQHRNLSALGRLAPSLLAFKPNLKDAGTLLSGIRRLPATLEAGTSALTQAEQVALANAAVNTGIAGGMETYDVASGHKTFDPLEAAINVLPGAALTRPTRIGQMLGYHAPENPVIEKPKPGVKGPTAETVTATPAEERTYTEAFGPGQRQEYQQPFRKSKGPSDIDKELEARRQRALDERLQQQMTNEGGPAPKEQVNIREEDFLLAKEEERAKALKQEEAAKLKAENDARETRLRTEAATKAGTTPATENTLRISNPAIQAGLEKNPLTQPEVTPSSAQKDYTQGQQARAKVNEIQSLTEAERIQQDFDLKKRNQEDAALVEQTKQDISKLSPAEKATLLKKLREDAIRRGFNIKTVPELQSGGKLIAGQIDLPTRTITLSESKAGFETQPHEGAHGFLNDLLNSSASRDQNLALRGLEYATGKKFTDVKSWQEYAKNNPAEAKAAEEKWINQAQDLEIFNQTRKSLYGNKREQFSQWLDNVKSHLKTKFGIDNPEDIKKFFAARYRKDAPYGTRSELLGGQQITGGTRNQDAGDYEQYQEVQAKLKALVDKKDYSSPEFQALWKQNEEIKNRNGGMPPTRQQESDYIRVYRGEGNKNIKLPEWALTNAGEWFTTNKRKAIEFQAARQGQLKFFDIPAKELEQFKAPEGNASDEYLIPKIAQENYNKVAQKNQEESALPAGKDYGRAIEGKLGEASYQAAKEAERLQQEEISSFNLNKRTLGAKNFIWPDNTKEAIKKANFKSQELEAFVRPDFERHQSEAHVSPGVLDNLLASQTQKIRNLGGETAKHVADKVELHAAEKSNLMGKYRNTIQAEISSYPRTVRDKVDQYGREMQEHGNSNVTLNGEEQSLYDHIREYLVKVADKNADLREISKDPNYWPALLNSRVAHVWSKNPNSPESLRYKREWMEHAQRVSPETSEKDLKGTLNDYVSAITGSEPSLTFGALRKAAGIGLPESLQDNNLLDRFSRYGTRVAKDKAYQILEADPILRYTLRIPNAEGKVQTQLPKLPSGEEIQDLRGNPQIKDYKKFLYNEFTTQSFPRIQAFTKALHSGLLGTATGIRNLVQAPNNVLEVIGTRNAGALVSSLSDFSNAWHDSFTQNARQMRMNDLEFGSAASPDMWTKTFNQMADIFRKYSGRELSEQVERAWEFGVGKAAALAEFGRAAKGEQTSIDWLKEHGNTIKDLDKLIGKNGADIPEDALNRIAKSVVDAAAGTYDERGLPAAVLEGPMAPFLNLTRWNIEKANRIYEHVIKPAKQGNVLPLLTYSLGSLLTGAAIKELNELISGGKRQQEPTFNEAKEAGNIQAEVRSVIGLMQLGSFGGIVGDIMKTSADALSGHAPRGLSYPTMDFLNQTVKQNLSDYFAAIQGGEPQYEATKALVETVIRDSVQTARLASYLTWNHEEVDRKNKYRDVRIWQELTKRATPESSIQQPNPFVDIAAKDFKRAQTGEEIADTFPKAIQTAIDKSEDYPELKKKFEGLRRNSYQTIPADPAERMMYLEYLSNTQGKDAAAERFMDYLRQHEVNKLKTGLVPHLP